MLPAGVAAASFSPAALANRPRRYPAGAIHRRLETRWLKPVRPGDVIQPAGIIKVKQTTHKSRWVLIDVMVRNQNDEKVAAGEAMVEFPATAKAS